MPADILIEIGCEEIPARFLSPALAQFKEKAEKALDKAKIGHGGFATYGTPRRLALAVHDVSEDQQGWEEKKLGPPAAQALGPDGKPTKAAEGFARSCGVFFDELGREQTDKGERLAFTRKIEGRPSREVLPGIFSEVILSLEFGKSMKWGSGDLKFVRPLHWVLALFGGEVIDMDLDGLRSGNKTRGHRFTQNREMEITGVADYLEQLSVADVIADPALRREEIEAGLTRFARENGWEIYPDPGLLDEVTNLVEFPRLVQGRIQDRFLSLPPEVLIVTMRAHQRYFSVRKPGTDKDLLPYFITVANNPIKDRKEAEAIIRRGNERVLGARLADAEFYYKEDLKTGLDKMREATAGMIFYKTLGSYGDKAERVAVLAERAATALFPGDEQVKKDAAAAAKICKADLVSQMVGSFPELQGVMGGYYAKMAGLSDAVAGAVSDHYLPRSAEDVSAGRFPRDPAGEALSIADKIDSLVSCWAAGLAPTGAGDPFALRRQFQGVAGLLLGRKRTMKLWDLIASASALISPRLKADEAKVTAEVIEFVKTRLKVQFTEAGHPHDAVEACLAVSSGDVGDTLQKIEALSRLKKRPDFDPLMIAFRRVMNIVEGRPGPVDADKFEAEAEAVLYSEYTRVKAKLGPLMAARDYDAALELVASLKPAVDRFFTDVMVNVEDGAVRQNRHALCSVVAELMKLLADFSKVVVEGDRPQKKK